MSGFEAIAMAAVGYRRESSEAAEKELAFDYQGERLEEYGCRWVFGDRVTGTRDNRSGLEQALDKIRSGEADELVVTHLFRLGRSVVTINRVIKLLKQHNAQLTILGGAINTATPEGRAFLQSQAVWGEYEAELGAERQKIGWENSRKKARPRVPVFGYRIVDGKYTPHEEHWDIAQRIIAKFFELQSLNRLAIWVNAEFTDVADRKRCDRPPLTWRGLKVWLNNPVLLGHVFFAGGTIRHLSQHPALLTTEQQNDILDSLESRRVPGERTSDRRYAYSGLMRCAKCGSKAGRVIVARNRRKRVSGENYLYYRCNRARIYQCENTARVRAEKIEAAVLSALSKQGGAIAQWLMTKPKLQLQSNPKILELQNQIERLLPVAEIDPRIKDAIRDLERAIANLQDPPDNQPSAQQLEEGLLILQTLSLPEYWKSMNAVEKNARLRRVIKQIWMDGGEVLGVDFLPWLSTDPAATGD